MKKPKQIYPIVSVIWEDIYSPDTGWVKADTLNETKKPCLMASVGYLIMEDAEHIFYASDLAFDGTVNGVTQIPRANVKELKVLKKVPNKRAKPNQQS